MDVAVKKACSLLVCAHLARKAAASGVAHWSCNREGPLGLISRSRHRKGLLSAETTRSMLYSHGRRAAHFSQPMHTQTVGCSVQVPSMLALSIIRPAL